MATKVNLPQLGQTMEEGTIVNCLVSVGDQVKRGDVLFEIETDKATLEMESPGEGFVKVIPVQTGQTIPVGDVVMVLGDKDEQVDASEFGGNDAPAQKAQAPEGSVPAAKPAESKPAPAASSAKAPASTNVVKLPQLGQTMEEGTIVNCLAKAGEEITKGQVIFEVETDKATLEMESPAAGCVKAVLVEAGQTIPVGEAVLVLGDKDEDFDQAYIDSFRRSVHTKSTCFFQSQTGINHIRRIPGLGRSAAPYHPAAFQHRDVIGHLQGTLSGLLHDNQPHTLFFQLC